MISAIFYKDFYKADHRRQYPARTEIVYSNLTARISRIPEIDHVVVFGIQYFVNEFLVKRFKETFFDLPIGDVCAKYYHRMESSLGPNQIGIEHIRELHELGFLPLEIKALPEGTVCPIKTPILTIRNTDARFYWVTNFLETLISNELWHPITSASIAYKYRQILDEYAEKTSDMPEFVQWQGHDFSMRGQTCLDAALKSGAAHLLSFTGTDTIPAIDWLEEHYDACSYSELIGGSVPATEHSVMCLGGQETEGETYRRLLTEVYPSGIVSIVSDTWDYWSVLMKTLPALRKEIMNRDGKLVVRPDSGDPVKIICGDPSARAGTIEKMGTIQYLWDLFGGRINSKGYKQLDPHIGVIYGDSITLEVCSQINKRLEEQGFASTNMVYGIGSYTYQYVTRDTFGFAMKATWGIIDGKQVSIFKDPKTDGGVKKSARGLLRVNEDLSLSEDVTIKEENDGLLQSVFWNGKTPAKVSLAQIRKRLHAKSNF